MTQGSPLCQGIQIDGRTYELVLEMYGTQRFFPLLHFLFSPTPQIFFSLTCGISVLVVGHSGQRVPKVSRESNQQCVLL